MERQQIEELLGKYLKGRIDNSGLDQLRHLCMVDSEKEKVIAVLKDMLMADKEVFAFNPADWKSMQQAILCADKTDLQIKRLFSRSVHRVHLVKRTWFRYAAAIVLIASSIAVFYRFSHTSPSGNHVVQTVPPATGDLPPATNRAVLTLSDGRQVELYPNESNTIEDGNLTIENADGQLIYKKSGVAAMNTMATPKGGQYQLSLVDGTKVWLNAASSITFPTAFTGKTREVAITGEAYFEVKPNKQKPFIVHTKTDDITVLGTSFNINAYPDESPIKTSLIDGSLKVNGTLIRPGEAYANHKVNKTNVDHDIAWKKGYFNLENVALEQAMREFARWYDVQIVYEQGVPKEELSGRMDRNITLQDALAGLEGVAARFKLKGRIVYVSPL